MGDISKGVANTLWPAKKRYKKCQLFAKIKIVAKKFLIILQPLFQSSTLL